MGPCIRGIATDPTRAPGVHQLCADELTNTAVFLRSHKTPLAAKRDGCIRRLAAVMCVYVRPVNFTTKPRFGVVPLWNFTTRCLKPLFQSEAKCEAIDIKMIFHSHANKTHFPKNKVLHFAWPVWKWEFLELGNGLFPVQLSWIKNFYAHKEEMQRI